MVDIVLIQPPIHDFYLTQKRTIPYGLCCIAAQLIDLGFLVEIFDSLATSKSKIIDIPEEMNYLNEYYERKDLSPFALFNKFKHFGYSYQHLGKIIKKLDPFLVGISSLFTAYSDQALKCAQVVKQACPNNCKVVLGGHHPTAMPQKVMESVNVDFVIRGEGEFSMPILAKKLKNNLSIESVPGIVFRNKDGLLHINDPAIVKDLDKCALPAKHLIKHKFYKRKKRHSTTVVASRGCPFKCSYCCFGTSGLKYRKRSVTNIIAEIEKDVKDNDIGYIDFEDENISINKAWFLDLLSKIHKNFSHLNFEIRAENGLLPSTLDEKIIKNMKQAGFKTLNLSVGTLSKPQLKRFNRKPVNDELEMVLDLAKKYNLTAVCYIIIGAPFQTAYDSLNDLLYLAQKRCLIGVSVYYPAPGSSDFNLLTDKNLLPEKLSLMRSSALPINHTTSRLETITLLRMSRIINFQKQLIDIENNDIENNDIENKDQNSLLFLQNHNKFYKERLNVGQKILNLFFDDGKIRGITSNHEIYEHKISLDLTLNFIKKLQSIKVKGVIST